MPQPHCAGENEPKLQQEDKGGIRVDHDPRNGRPKSQSASKRSKKAKTEMVDYTVLQEAVSRSTIRAVVCGQVVEHVPQSIPMIEGMRYEPLGNPVAERIPFEKFKRIPGKSFYRQYLDSLEPCDQDTEAQAAPEGTTATSLASSASETSAALRDSTPDSSSKSGVISGAGVLEGGADEAEAIHRENLSRLAQLSPAEIKLEREQILSQCDPKLIGYIKSLRSKKEGVVSKVGGGGVKKKSGASEEKSEVERKQRQTTQDHGETGLGQNTEANVISGKNRTPMEVVRDAKVCGYMGSTKKSASSAEIVGDPKPTSIAMEEGPQCDDAELPISPAEAKKWMHMDKVELDKLRWTTPLPSAPPLLTEDQPYVARFSLAGELLPYDAERDTKEGLHHHGDEPGRAGYSLDELFVLARSAVHQQRQLSLAVLTAMLSKLGRGHYYGRFQVPLLHTLLESGLVLLLRFSLDDSVPLVRAAGISALAALLAGDEMELALQTAHPWAGPCRPAVASEMHSQEEVRAELRNEEAELKDAELLQLDVVRALIRVDTLVRIRYIVEQLTPPPESVLQLFSILRRVAAHSLTAAWKVATTPGLLGCLLERYLPHNTARLLTGTNALQMTSVEGVPLRQALSLLQVLCSWGRQLSSELVTKYDLMTKLVTFVSLPPFEVSLPLSEVLRLSIEAHFLWATLIGYGLHPPQTTLLSFYPMVMRQLTFYRDRVAINEDMGSNQFNFDLGTSLIYMLNRTLSVAATKTLLDTQLKQNSNLQAGVEDRLHALQPPLIAWDSLVPAAELVLICTVKWFTLLQRGKTTFAGLRLLGATCIFAENYFRKLKDQKCSSGVQLLTEIEGFYGKTLSPFLRSDSFSELLSEVRRHSALCSGYESSAREDPKNLSTLNTVSLEGSVTPVLLPSSPFPLLLPLSSLVLTLHQMHPSLSPVATRCFVNNTQLAQYLQTLIRKELSLKSQWFTRIESNFLANLVQIAGLKGCNCPVLYHSVALVTMPCLQKGQEHIAKTLLTQVVCNAAGLEDLVELSTQIGNIGLDDYEPLRSPALLQPSLVPSKLTTKLVTDMPSIGAQLATSLFEPKSLKESAVWCKDIPFLISSMTINHSESLNIFEEYWTLLPLKKVMLENVIKQAIGNEKSSAAEKERASELPDVSYSDQSKPELIVEISRCIQLTYLCLKHRNSVTMKSSNITGWLKFLSLTFLVTNDLFLDNSISSYLQGCLHELLRGGGYKLFDDKLEFSGLGNTFDWYKKLIEQYSAVSYGDSTFALFLLLPTQMIYPTAFRALLWGDLSDALPLIRLKSEEVARFIPVAAFLEPVEKDEEMLQKYRSAIMAGLLSEARSPFLWQLAMHHIRASEQAAKVAAGT